VLSREESLIIIGIWFVVGLGRINVRVEHVNHSKCRTDFLNRVKENEALKLDAKAKGIRVVCKRQVIYLKISSGSERL
jgi:hypothetical protein